MSAGAWSEIVSHYERCFQRSGARPEGVDWPNGRDLEARYATQLSILEAAEAGSKPVLLDVGCGPGLLLDYLKATDRLDELEYRGLDLSTNMIEAAKQRWPDRDFSIRNIVTDPLPERGVDFVIMNGVLTEKVEVSQDAMIKLAQPLIIAAFRAARVGIAFNVMSHHVDRQRADLFHWGFDELAAFLKQDVSRHYTFRADYGLYEYTALVWRNPRRPAPAEPQAWWER